MKVDSLRIIDRSPVEQSRLGKDTQISPYSDEVLGVCPIEPIKGQMTEDLALAGISATLCYPASI
jgi:hypothetical protein